MLDWVVVRREGTDRGQSRLEPFTGSRADLGKKVVSLGVGQDKLRCQYIFREMCLGRQWEIQA